MAYLKDGGNRKYLNRTIIYQIVVRNCVRVMASIIIIKLKAHTYVDEVGSNILPVNWTIHTKTERT